MKIDKMGLLETYVQIAKFGSISKAADDLDISQSTTSRRLQKLEELIGQSLVHRSTRDFIAMNKISITIRHIGSGLPGNLIFVPSKF